MEEKKKSFLPLIFTNWKIMPTRKGWHNAPAPSNNKEEQSQTASKGYNNDDNNSSYETL